MINKESFEIHPIGQIRTPFKEKFAVPRQPGLAPDIISVIEFFPPYNDELAFEGIEGFSHIHVIFLFDKIEYSKFRPKVRPPRLGGNVSVGVFATRSPFRPNTLGLSILKIHRVIKENSKIKLEVSGADLVDKTPIIDIKPYIPFVDSIPDAIGGFAKEKPPVLDIAFENDSQDKLQELGDEKFTAICQALSQDPRPAYKETTTDTKMYQAKLYNKVINFNVHDNVLRVVAVENTKEDLL